MPRKAEWPPKIRYCNGRARIRVKGKDYYLGPYGRPEAQSKYDELIKQFESQPPPQPVITLASATVAAVCEEFLSHRERQHLPKRETVAYAEAIRPLVRLFGKLPAANFGCAELEQVQLSMADGSWMNAEERSRRMKHKQPIGCCRNVVNHRIRRIRTVWRFAEKRKLIPPGHWQHLKVVDPLPPGSPIVRETTKVQPTKFSDLLAVVRVAPYPVGHMLLLQWWTGMRTGEIRKLKWSEIQDGCIILGQHKTSKKTGQDRVIPLGPKCRAILNSVVERSAKQSTERCNHCRNSKLDVQRCSAGLAEHLGFEYVFSPRIKRKHDYYTRCAFKTVVNRACAKAGVKIRPYGSRHAAKDRFARVAGVEAARQILGHKTLRMTDHYGGVNLQLMKDAMDRAG